MLFLDQPVVAGDPFCSQKVCVLVTCKSGAHHLITASRYRSSEVTKVTERSGDLVLQDLCDGAEVCSLVLPASHFLACPWNPVWALEPAEQTLFIRGDERTYADEPQESGHPASSLFVFRLRESSVSNRFCQPASAAVPMPRGTGYASLEETCNVYLQQR
ncbi:hypothetical protein JZ751_024213 [Albula glossodonta]|uniref:Uncharacterized protein n=1 Tax=Albula glossodonta TaxID=121402 RepID=A0A8T2MXU7_9TELE|nr:hypothetical protein JZ751_024213 [Albula glossodonta]